MAAGPAPVLLWFRDDLRVADHPALVAAARTGRPVVPVFVRGDEDGPWDPGEAARWWQDRALAALAEDLVGLGLRLILRRGSEPDVVRELAAATGADAVHACARWEPAARARDADVARALAAEGVAFHEHDGDVLWRPDAVRTGQGDPYRVFTPFWKRVLGEPAPPRPLAPPRGVTAPAVWPESLSLAALELQPASPRATDLGAVWRPGGDGAQAALRRFLAEAAADYPEGRDRPDRSGTSRLSPHLRAGDLSVRAFWHALGNVPGGNEVRRQLVWREFARHLLHHFPATVDSPLDGRFERFPWEGGADDLSAWRSGGTGYPLVDAGMRELEATGWMHNRVRMVAASFLIKHLLVRWQEGAAWFWERLVDADLANNTLGWQWVAGCGADAAPFFRIFNPVLQGRRHDPEGAYVRRWVPELAGLSDRWLHRPWQAPARALADAGVELDVTYPRPRVDHDRARARALAAWARIRRG